MGFRRPDDYYPPERPELKKPHDTVNVMGLQNFPFRNADTEGIADPEVGF